MALNPIEILKDTIASVAHTIVITSVDSLGGSSYKLNTTNTLYLNNKTEVTIDSVVYIITDFVINSYITVEAVDGSDTIVTVSSFTINSPLFIWGSPQLVSIELAKRITNNDAVWPYMWVVQTDTNKNTLDPAAAVKTTASYNILLLDSADKTNWDIETHYEENIYPLNNYITFFMDILKSRRDIFATDLITYDTTDVVNFGDYIVDKGNEEKILNDNVTGIQLQLDAPLIIQTCDDFVVLPNCPVIIETFNGAAITSPISQKTIIVQSDAVGNPQVGTKIVDTATALTVEVPAAAGASIDIDINGVSYGVGFTTNQDIVVQNSVPSPVGTVDPGVAHDIADSNINFNFGGNVTGQPAETNKLLQVRDTAAANVGAVTGDTALLLQVEIDDCTVENSDQTFTTAVVAEATFVTADNDYEVFVNGVSEATATGPSLVDQIINITIN